MKLRVFYFSLFLSLFLFSCNTAKIKTEKQRTEKVEQIINYSYKYIGTPYRSGGTTPKGFDCSGFTQYVFNNFDYKLPRTSSDQSNAGTKIKRKDLEKGDLVFFKGRNQGSKKVGHVGIVVSVGKGDEFRFIHASTSRGIVVSSISENYYKTRYLSARRIVP